VNTERPADRANHAFLSLRTAIVEGALPPGTRLPEDVIAAQYGVSRTLVRATLARLTSAGLVDTGRAKSALVANPSVDEARATFELRRCLEREAVRLAAQRASEVGLARLREHVQREQEAAESADAQVSGRLGAEFHIALSELTGNPLLERYLGEVIWRCALILSVHGKDHDQHRSVEEHAMIINLIEKGDAAACAEVIERHIEAVEARALPPLRVTGKLDIAEVLSRY
jgi:DNA-binding GntR family transcriptional regulator